MDGSNSQMKKRKTKKQKLELEKAVFAVVLWSIGVVVVSLFSILLFQGPAAGGIGADLQTSVVQGGTSGAGSSSTDMAKSLIVAGALGFCVLGFAIFIGLKIKDRFF
jgi:hypothetical protein